MMYTKRPHSLTDLESAAKMARELKRTTWTACTGFRAGSLIALNDSTGPDNAQEYAIIRDGVQIESIAVSWMELEALTELLIRLDRGEGGVVMGRNVEIVPHVQRGGYCQHCA